MSGLLDVYIDGQFKVTISESAENDYMIVLKSMGKDRSCRIVPHGTDLEAIKRKLVSSDIKKANKQD